MSESLQMKRLMSELTDLKKNPPESFYDDLRTWHFTVRGPENTEYEEGIYHGKIELSSEYPIKPPNLYFLTPNGRFETNTKICLSITKFHPEHWSPSYTSKFTKFEIIVRIMIDAILNHFPIKDDITGVGGLEFSKTDRKKLAILSKSWKCDKCGSIENLVPERKKKEKTEKIENAEDEKEKETNNEKKNLEKEKKENEEYKNIIEMKSLLNQQSSNFIENLIQTSFENYFNENFFVSKKHEKDKKNLLAFLLKNFREEEIAEKSIKFSKNKLNLTEEKDNNKRQEINTILEKSIEKNEIKNNFDENSPTNSEASVNKIFQDEKKKPFIIQILNFSLIMLAFYIIISIIYYLYQ